MTPIAGEYTFYLASDDGSRLDIDGQKVVDHDGAHALEAEEMSGSMMLSSGEHDIEVEFFEASGGDALLISWQGPQLKKQPVQARHLSSLLQTSQPALSGTSALVDYAYDEGNWTKNCQTSILWRQSSVDRQQVSTLMSVIEMISTGLSTQLSSISLKLEITRSSPPLMMAVVCQWMERCWSTTTACIHE